MKIKKICVFIFFMCLASSVYLKTSDTIVFGQSANFEGPFRLYGNIIRNGILARIYRINDEGGIRGKKLELKSLDDLGDPVKSQSNVEHMLADGIDMFVGNMGTRSILQVLPLIRAKRIAMFFPWSGEDRFRDPTLTNIINGPGLLNQQLVAIMDYIEENLKLHKIAVFYSDDDFSTSAAKYLIKELSKRIRKKIVSSSYNRFTMDINKAADILLASDPKIVICISTSMPVVKLINIFFEKGHYGTKFFGVDSTLFVGIIEHARGVDFHYSSAVPDPLTSNILLARQYLEDLKKYFPQDTPNVLSFTYYISMAIIIDAIQSISGQITKEKIINAIENMQKHSIGGFEVNFDPNNRHAFGQEISIIKG